MKCIRWAVAFVMMGCATSAQAQMGMDYFTRPAIAKVFHPNVGKGAVYQSTSTTGGDAKSSTIEIGIVGKESVEGKDAYWVETSLNGPKDQPMVGKTLMLLDGDVKIIKVVIQQAGQPAMEMPMMGGPHQSKVNENLNDWHSVGTESITVPAGTYSCEHWKNDKNGSEIWTSDKVPSYGMVKEISKNHTMVLVKVLDNYQDKITGPVKKFDMQEMMQQMQQQRQQNQ